MGALKLRHVVIVASIMMAVCLVVVYARRHGRGVRPSTVEVQSVAVVEPRTSVPTETAAYASWPATVEEIWKRPAYTPVDDEVMAELCEVCNMLIQAYSNDSAAVFHEWAKMLPAKVELLPEDQFHKVVDPILLLCFRDVRNFAEGQNKPAFADATSLEAFLDTKTTAVRLVGDMTISRPPLDSGVAASLEGFMFKCLGLCKELSIKEGDSRSAELVSRYQQAWISFVESDCGYNRRLAFREIAIKRINGFRVIGERSWEDFVAYRSEQAASFLIHCGYTPRWIEELKKAPPPEWAKVRNRARRE